MSTIFIATFVNDELGGLKCELTNPDPSFRKDCQVDQGTNVYNVRISAICPDGYHVIQSVCLDRGLDSWSQTTFLYDFANFGVCFANVGGPSVLEMRLACQAPDFNGSPAAKSAESTTDAVQRFLNKQP